MRGFDYDLSFDDGVLTCRHSEGVLQVQGGRTPRFEVLSGVPCDFFKRSEAVSFFWEEFADADDLFHLRRDLLEDGRVVMGDGKSVNLSDLSDEEQRQVLRDDALNRYHDTVPRYIRRRLIQTYDTDSRWELYEMMAEEPESAGLFDLNPAAAVLLAHYLDWMPECSSPGAAFRAVMSVSPRKPVDVAVLDWLDVRRHPGLLKLLRRLKAGQTSIRHIIQ